MNEKLQELTNKIYQEGLEKGKNEADQIIDKAKKEAEKMISSARDEASQIRDEANKDAEELKKNTASELTMSTRQAITTIKQQISNIVATEAVKDALGKAFDDKDFIKNLILKIAENWDKIEKDGQDVMMILSEKDKKELEGFLMKKAAEKIKGALEINFEESIKSGFKIGPKDGSYILSFTDEDFKTFFKQYLRPRTRKFFEEEE
jgi:V/A-type H+/Na+-transporting ATPase subunit E